jgi:hypothetical protein
MTTWFSRQCGDCKSERLLRSRRRSIQERLLGIILLPWCCEKCGWRGFKLRNVKIAAETVKTDG